MAYHSPPERKEECQEAIRRAVTGLEPKTRVDLTPIYEQFPEIQRTTIASWAARIRTGQPTARDLTKAAQAIDERVKAGALDHMPAVPSPQALARDNGKAIRQIDFGREIPRLYADAEMLRAFSIKDVEGEDGETVEKIKNPVAFEKSIKARASLIETGLKVLSQVWDMRMMQQFNEILLEEILKESPECQRRILQRLAQVNQRHGMNFNGLRI